jgi:hypothetical protein
MTLSENGLKKRFSPCRQGFKTPASPVAGLKTPLEHRQTRTSVVGDSTLSDGVLSKGDRPYSLNFELRRI